MLSMELKKVIPWAKRPYDLIDLIHNNTTTLPVGEKISRCDCSNNKKF